MHKLWAITWISVACLVLVVAFGTCARKQENELSSANHNPQTADSSKSKRIEGKVVRFDKIVLNGNTACYFSVSGANKIFVQLFVAGVSSPYLQSVQPGDDVIVDYEESQDVLNSIQHFDVPDSTKRRMFGTPLPNDPTSTSEQGQLSPHPTSDLFNLSGSAVYKHIPGSLGYNAPSSLGPEFPSHETQPTQKDLPDPVMNLLVP